MKYVRTKDSVYDVYIDDLNSNDKIHQEIAGFRVIHCRGLDKPISKENIVKVADTIEKLCDEFVLINKNSDLLPSTEKSYHDFSPYLDADIRRHEKPSYIEIYGAIWTDKGLIYVAKMNEKGELELL